MSRPCAWCARPLPTGRQRTCSTPCQVKHQADNQPTLPEDTRTVIERLWWLDFDFPDEDEPGTT